MADCNTPPQRPCGPGPFVSQTCYTVPPSLLVLSGFRQVTLNPDCSLDTVVILDDAQSPVPGAVEVPCPNPLAPPDCCNADALCSILQTLPTQVPGVTDTALFVDPIAGCFLGVPGGGGGGFPGYGAPVTTACANAPGVSLLVARADHVHRSEVPVQDEGVLVGSRCSINFIGDGVTAVDNAGLDRVDVTIPAFTGGTVTSQILAASGSCAAPSYSFTASPDSGMFYTGTAVRISDDNCTDFIDVGASINTSSAAATSITAGTSITATAATSMTLTATAAAMNLTAGTTLSLTATGAAVTVDAGTVFSVTTGATLRLTIQSAGAWSIGGSVGSASNVLTSNGAGVPPTWQAAPTAFPGFGVPPANTVDAAAPTAGVATTALRSDAKLQAATGTPVAVNGTTNSDGIAATLARSDHVHRLELQVLDGGALIGSRPRLNFIDGANISITAVDNGGSDRVDVTIATSIPAGTLIQRIQYNSNDLRSTNPTDWAVNNEASEIADSINNSLFERRFDDTTEEGIGEWFTIPPGAGGVTIEIKHRAQTAPGVAAAVQPTLYSRAIPDNAAIPAWSAPLNLTALTIPTNTNWQYDQQTFTLAALGWTAGQLTQWELTRRGTQVGDTLTGNWNLIEINFHFTT